MNSKKNIIVLFLLIFVIVSCKTIDRKIDNLSLEEEKNLSKYKPLLKLYDQADIINDII